MGPLVPSRHQPGPFEHEPQGPRHEKRASSFSPAAKVKSDLTNGGEVRESSNYGTLGAGFGQTFPPPPASSTSLTRS